MKPKKLSDAALLLLRVIDEVTKRDKDGKLERFFVPPHGYKTAYASRPDGRLDKLYVSGSGLAAAFRALESRGLVERHAERGDIYWSWTTKAGHDVVEAWKNDVRGKKA